MTFSASLVSNSDHKCDWLRRFTELVVFFSLFYASAKKNYIVLKVRMMDLKLRSSGSVSLHSLYFHSSVASANPRLRREPAFAVNAALVASQ